MYDRGGGRQGRPSQYSKYALELGLVDKLGVAKAGHRRGSTAGLARKLQGSIG